MYVPPPARICRCHRFSHTWALRWHLAAALLGAIILVFIGAVILLVIVKVIKQLTA